MVTLHWLYVFSIFLIFNKQFACGEEDTLVCKQQNPCVCSIPDLQGPNGFNLTNLGNQPLEVQHSGVNETQIFRLQLCKNANMTDLEGDCQKSLVSLCLKKNNATGISLGTVEETRIISWHREGLTAYAIILKHNDITTTINLACCPGCTTANLNLDGIQNDTSHYRLELTSKSSCPVQVHSNDEHHGLSFGSRFLISLLLCFSFYFIGGGLLLKYYRGATGLELIPHHAFWLSLPSLVQDGYRFVINGCRPGIYEQI